MSPMQHAFTEHSIVGTSIKLAQTTFYDALPANAEMKTPTAPKSCRRSSASPARVASRNG